jgi:phage repressor protein C with HTH and peptisase S24 domain
MMKKIPTSYIKAAAGVGNFMDEENFEEQEYPENVVPFGTDFALFVDGNSMSPIYVDGQVIFVKQCNTVELGQVGIFSIDNEVVIKIYDEQEPDDSCKDDFTDSSGFVHPQVVLRSYNSDWAPRPISPYQEFHVYGRVLN